MASIKRTNLDLKMGYSGGVTLPGGAEANFAAYADSEGKNLRYVRCSGTTSQRPLDPPPGHPYYDTTLAELIFYDGSEWVAFTMGTGTNLVRTMSDLPAPSSGVITLDDGIWEFQEPVVAPADVSILQPNGAFVRSVVGKGGWITNTAGVGFESVNYYNYDPFYTQNTGGGFSLWSHAGGGVSSAYRGWYVPGPTKISSPYFEWNEGRLDNVTVLCAGGDKHFDNIRYVGTIRMSVGSSGRTDGLYVNRCGKIYASGTDPLVLFEASTYNLTTLAITNCRSEQGGLVKMPSGYSGGVPWGNVNISNCHVSNATNGIELVDIPLGGIEVYGCSFTSVTNPVSGFSAASARTYMRENFKDGVKMTETVIT